MDDYLLYLLIRNFSSQPQDKLSEIQLRYLLQTQQRLPDHTFQQFSNQAKQTKKLRKQLPLQEQERIRFQEDQKFADFDPSSQNPNQQKSQLIQQKSDTDMIQQLQQENKQLQLRSTQLQQENENLKQQLQKHQKCEFLAQELENEKELNYDSTRKIQQLSQQLLKYKEFAYNLAQFESLPEDDLHLIYTKIAKTVNNSARKIKGAKSLIPDITLLQDQIQQLRNFCMLEISSFDIENLILKVLKIEGMKSTFANNIQQITKIFIQSSTDFDCGKIDIFDEKIYQNRTNEFINQRTRDLLATDPVLMVFLQETALLDLQNILKTMTFKRCVVSSFSKVNNEFVDSFQGKNKIKTSLELLKVELTEQVELLKVVNLIFKKTKNADQVCVLFWVNNIMQSVFLCGCVEQEIREFYGNEKKGAFAVIGGDIKENWVFVGEGGYKV
ncbi:hypothetical protein SS50377_24366 [Spironucleus salmonicida]|uniref:Uncharacterized protein n=1 Tax=Spironucleus salmonicida TaxID=348837 RepID=V6LPB6_9EUKA|nr:hypothetical protein SS50377_24366 [Spironucleus salmonicida]|eukprot:EST46083.1 Hypothetical protein SS50377_14073 [Spironucleus salmonicida]